MPEPPPPAVNVTFPPSALSANAHAIFHRRGGGRTSTLRLAAPPALVAMYRECGARREFAELPHGILVLIAEYATCCSSSVFNGAQAGTLVVLG